MGVLVNYTEERRHILSFFLYEYYDLTMEQSECSEGLPLKITIILVLVENEV